MEPTFFLLFWATLGVLAAVVSALSVIFLVTIVFGLIAGIINALKK